MCKRWVKLCESPRLWRNITIYPDALREVELRKLNVLPWLRKRLGAVISLRVHGLGVSTVAQSWRNRWSVHWLQKGELSDCPARLGCWRFTYILSFHQR